MTEGSELTVTEDTARKVALMKAVGLDKLAPEQRELAVNIAKRYDLDLLLKHLVIIEGRAYITRDGLIHVAHRSGVFDGIEVTPAVLDDKFWRSTCSVYRKDMSRPFTYPGRYPSQGGNAKYNEEMAVKVAEVAALRRAFDVSAPTVEERWAEEAPEADPPKKRTLAAVAAAKAASVAAAPEILSEPMTVDDSATISAVCGHVAGDGLMGGSVCIEPIGHKGFHRAESGTWPQP